jgi:hypothetical protein
MQTLLLFLLCASALAAQPFQAGAARRDITPREPVPMWGYADRHDALSQGVQDPLHADAIVLDAGGRKLAIVGLDLGRAPAEPSLQRIRARILKETGIEHSLIGGSHTHHGPVLELSDAEGKGGGLFDATLRYYAQMEDAIAEAVIEANTKLQPANLAAGSVRLDGFNANRHSKLEPKPRDLDLSVLRLDATDSKPIAVLVNWAAHPTTIASGVLKISADYVGALKNYVSAETGAAAVFIQGAAGDMRTDRGSKDYRAYGEALGAEAVKLARSLSPLPVEKPSLQVQEERFRFTPRLNLRDPLISGLFEKAFFPELVRHFQDEYEDGVRPRLTVTLLNGEIAMVGVSGEFFSSHAVRLKERARVRQLFFFGYCNGYHQYFPTIEAAAEGGYGATPAESPAAVGAGEQLMNTALIWLYRMREKLKP